MSSSWNAAKLTSRPASGATTFRPARWKSSGVSALLPSCEALGFPMIIQMTSASARPQRESSLHASPFHRAPTDTRPRDRTVGGPRPSHRTESIRFTSNRYCSPMRQRSRACASSTTAGSRNSSRRKARSSRRSAISLQAIRFLSPANISPAATAAGRPCARESPSNSPARQSSSGFNPLTSAPPSFSRSSPANRRGSTSYAIRGAAGPYSRSTAARSGWCTTIFPTRRPGSIRSIGIGRSVPSSEWVRTFVTN